MVRNHLTSAVSTVASDEPFSPATCTAVLAAVVAGSWLVVVGVLHAVVNLF